MPRVQLLLGTAASPHVWTDSAPTHLADVVAHGELERRLLVDLLGRDDTGRVEELQRLLLALTLGVVDAQADPLPSPPPCVNGLPQESLEVLLISIMTPRSP